MHRTSEQQHEPTMLAQGVYRVDLGRVLGHQEICVSLLNRAEDGDFELVIGKAITTTRARHVLVAGVMASAVYSHMKSASISLPNGEYSLARADLPMSSQSQVLKGFARLRKTRPDSSHILVCPTSPDLASDAGLFDRVPGAEEGAAVFVIGYGKGYNNLLANFHRCVNSPGKAQGSVHSVVSLYGSTRIVNEDLEKLESTADSTEKLRYFWEMENLRWGPTQMPTLLGISAG